MANKIISALNSMADKERELERRRGYGQMQVSDKIVSTYDRLVSRRKGLMDAVDSAQTGRKPKRVPRKGAAKKG